MKDTPAEEGVRLDLVGTALSALGLGADRPRRSCAPAPGASCSPSPTRPEWLGLSPVIWLILGGRRGAGAVPALGEPAHRARRGRADRPGDAAQPPAAQRGHARSCSCSSSRPGTFFVVPLFLSVALGALGDRDRRAAASALAVAAAVRRRRPEAAPERLAAAGRPPRLHRAVRRPRPPGRPARHRRRAGDRDLAAAAGRRRARRDGLAARRRDRVRGARRAERRGRRAAEHRHPARRVDRHRAGRRACSSPR